MIHLSMETFKASIDMNQTEIKNARMQFVSADPTSPAPIEGQFWYRSDLHRAKLRLASTTIDLADGGIAASVVAGGVTLAMHANLTAQNTFIGRKTAGAGAPEEMSQAEARTALGLGSAAYTASTAYPAKIHNLIDTTNHPVTGLTTGQLLSALSATTYGFSAYTVNDAGTTTADIWTASKVNSTINTAIAGVASGLLTPVADLAAMKAVTTASLASNDKFMRLIETLGLYRWDKESVAASDDVSVIRPTDQANDAVAGKWLRMSTILNDHNSMTGMNGGSSGQYYHLTSAQATALTPITGLASATPQAPGTAAAGNATLVARENHVHPKQVGFSHLHVYSTGTTDVTNSPFTPADGDGSLQIRAGSNITLGVEVTTGVVTINAVASGTVAKYSTNVGDGSATSYVITHSLNTRDVQVIVYLNSDTYEQVCCDIQMTSVNTVTLLFAVAPTASQYRVVVVG